MIIRPREHLMQDGMPPSEMLGSVLREHAGEAIRLGKLRDIYENKSTILKRTRADGLPNNKIAHPYARYITTIATGYLIGNPVTYMTENDHETMKQIQEIFRRYSEAAENVQLARDQSIYGKGVEYAYVDESAMPKSTTLSPLNAFVVYSNTYDMEPLFGVYYLPRMKANGDPDGWRIWVMSTTAIAMYESQRLDDLPAPMTVEPHYFGGVPLVEYWNDENENGDFECVLPLLDAYDKLQSDRVNDKEQFVDRLLVLTGVILEEDEKGRKPMQQLREDHALQLPDSQSKAEYLTSEMNETDVEVLRKSLLEDIHKLTLVPDMSDAKFASNASGVAMRYKLLGFEQLTRTKERWFTEGLRSRLKLFIHFLGVKGFPVLDVADIKITFTHALPANLQENAQTVQNATTARAVSLETAVRMLHEGSGWTDADVKLEVERIRVEQGVNLEPPIDPALGDNEGNPPAGDQGENDSEEEIGEDE